MQGNVELGLHLVGNDPSLTFILFVALTLLLVLGLRFSFYAYRNDRASDLGQERLWRTLVAVGLTAALFAVLGIVEIVSSLRTPYRRALLLAQVLVLAVAMATLYRTAVPDAGGTAAALDRAWLAGALAVVVVFLGGLLAADHPALTAVEGLAALALAGVGLVLGRRGTAASRVQGTVVDTLLRHLLPVLLFAALIPVVELAVFATLDRVVVLHVQVVFIIMTATALMTATIKLRQNLAGL